MLEISLAVACSELWRPAFIYIVRDVSEEHTPSLSAGNHLLDHAMSQPITCTVTTLEKQKSHVNLATFRHCGRTVFLCYNTFVLKTTVAWTDVGLKLRHCVRSAADVLCVSVAVTTAQCRVFRPVAYWHSQNYIPETVIWFQLIQKRQKFQTFPAILNAK
jgi:hypothetical protein